MIVAVLAVAVILIHVLFVRLMAHGHVAHVLLGSANHAPPIGAALLAVALLVARFLSVVIAPGALLASATSLAAHVLVGPKGGGRARGEAAGGDAASDAA